jgi:ribosome-associated toxin RatA of RatAB toxin-antitoxin module
VRSSIAIDVAAGPELVFGLAHDVTRWEALLPHYARSRPITHLDDRVICEFVARREVVPFVGLGLPVAWRSRTWSDPETCTLRFVHLGGATAGMDVTWRIEPTTTGCRVTIEHAFDPPVPGWAAFVDRAFTRPIAGRTLATFKALAETLAGETERSTRRTGAYPLT